MDVVGWALMIVGAAMLLWSLTLTVRANTTTRIPYWRNSVVIAPGSIILRSVGVGLLIFGAVTFSPSPVYGTAALLLLALLPALIIIPARNRRIDKK
ncbi:MAG: hypothetical protein ACOH1M_07780 [Rhodoglobus sp.]